MRVTDNQPRKLIGYARACTVEQVAGVQAQIAELGATGCKGVLAGQVSSVEAKRAQREEATRYVRERDTFMVTPPDRLARSRTDLLITVQGLTEGGVRVPILSIDVDSATPFGKLLLTLMDGVAAFERELKPEWQRDRIAAAKAAGNGKGRRSTAPADAERVLELKRAGKRVAEIVRQTGVRRTTVYRLLAKAAGSTSGTPEASSAGGEDR